ncbi:hypothetical protein [Sinomonas atrocyanea]|jgi:hypothetical protein|uniref:hypothetical protein n=1 Tax=Sinomonas atrocyanea TaxID=37927 RepID=UPI002785B1A8|nr:hypothetical protein [Sinomonas atrocyanea]MDQ0258811.1 hypothetical protein [Sinomonas atrocyanea]MDR6620997.1 hypothetical protein [Sinomonas atrocyanea]
MSTQQQSRPEVSGPAVGTIVWGAVVIVMGALMFANRLGWLTIDPGYAAAGVLLLAGLGLVVGGVLAARRRRALPDDDAAGTPSDAGTSQPAAGPGPSPYETLGPRGEGQGPTD